MSNKINSKSIIAESSTSIMIFAIPALILISSVFYLSTKQSNNYFTIFCVNVLMFIPAFLGFYKKNIILTRNSIYVYVRGEKKISWNLINDLYLIDIEQNKYGKFFGYGTLILVNKNKQMYQYHFLNNVEEFKIKIIKRYEKNMIKIDPNFVPTYITEEENNKKLDSLEEVK